MLPGQPGRRNDVIKIPNRRQFFGFRLLTVGIYERFIDSCQHEMIQGSWINFLSILVAHSSRAEPGKGVVKT